MPLKHNTGNYDPSLLHDKAVRHGRVCVPGQGVARTRERKRERERERERESELG